MYKLTLFLYLLHCLNNFINAQQAAPWRNRIQWVNNGQVFSLMSTGSEYQAPVPSRRQSRIFLSSNGNAVRDRTVHMPTGASNTAPDSGTTAHLGPDSMQYIVANSRAPGARQVQMRQRARGPPGTRANGTILPEYSGSDVQVGNYARRASPRADIQQLPAPTESSNTLPNSDVANEMSLTRTPVSNVPTGEQGITSNNMADDPRHRNTIFYNIHPANARAVIPRRPPPGTGYGTRFFHNGELRAKWRILFRDSFEVMRQSCRDYNYLVFVCRSSRPRTRPVFDPGGLLHPARSDVRAPVRGGGELLSAVNKT